MDLYPLYVNIYGKYVPHGKHYIESGRNKYLFINVNNYYKYK